MNKTEEIKRIQKMEKILEKSTELFEDLNKILNSLEQNEESFKKIFNYYFNGKWQEDRDILFEENSSLDSDILDYKVLSEDSIYDLTSEQYKIAIKMLEVATKIIKYY